MNDHDPFCKCYYPALTDTKTCTWCYVIRRVRIDEYLQAWNEGFGIGFEEGKEKAKEIYTNDCFECGYAGEWSTWVCENCRKENPDIIDDYGLDVSTNEDIHNLSQTIEDDPIARGIRKYEEDIDIAYWQGYNNAMVEMDEASAEQASAAGTSNPPTTTQKLDTLGFLHLGTQDYMCPFCVTPWKCNGPHIDEGDMENFLLYIEDRNAKTDD